MKLKKEISDPTELEILLKNIKDFEPKVPVEYNDECLDPIMINDETSGNSVSFIC